MKNKPNVSYYLIVGFFCSVPIIVLYSIYDNFRQGSLSSISNGVIGLILVFLVASPFFAKTRFGKLMQTLSFWMFLFLALFILGLAVMGLLVLPFSDQDASIDLEIIVIKSWVVKTILLVVEVIALFLVLRWLKHSLPKFFR